MNIGDRVRMLHSSEEGIVVKVLNSTMVEVEIEDGFGVPALVSELVIVAKEETKTFGGNDRVIKESSNKKEMVKKEVIAQKGLFIAFQELNDKKLDVYLINNTDFDLLFIFGKAVDTQYESVNKDLLRKKSHIKISQTNLQNFEKWGTFVFQFLFYKSGIQNFSPPLLKKMRFRASTFFKNKQTIPSLNVEGFLFQLDKEDVQTKPLDIKENIADNKKETLDPEKLKEKMFEPQPSSEYKDSKPYKQFVSPPKIEVDLHIEAITKDYEKMNSSDIIKLQLDTFLKAFDNAIINGLNEIVFIHGVGNGKLRNEIHKHLSKSNDIEYYKDARKERFGYGATLVKIKS